MRLVRLGEETSKVGSDVRAALASWGRGNTVVGGVALAGCQPEGCPVPVDAVVVLPRGVLVVLGVDLPDPAVRLDAPLAGQWKTDGWPLVRPDGAVNPATEAMEAVGVITRLLEAAKVEPLPVGTVVAVGPYVSKVHQPTSDLMRGVRILHPEPMNLITATRELAVHQRPCTVTQARAILEALQPENAEIATIDLAEEGFANTAVANLAAESTTLIPRVAPTSPSPPAPSRPAGTASRGSAREKPVRWLPAGAAVLVAMLLLTGIVYAVASAGDGDETDPRGVSSTQTESNDIEVGGLTFTPKGTVSDADCAAHAYGDVQVWLEANRCDELVRMRYESTVDDKTAAILVAVLRFPESALAGELNTVADEPGSGAISDVSAEGVEWPGGVQAFFESAAYASGREGNSLKLVQAVWVGESSDPNDERLTELADNALKIPAPS